MLELPESRDAVLLQGLHDYLVEQTSPYGLSEWGYHSDTHRSGDVPMGSIEMILLKPDSEKFGRSFDYYPKLRRFRLRLLISHSNKTECKALMLRWMSFIIDTSMRDLSFNGYEDLFQGIELVQAVPKIEENQDDGAKAIVFLDYDFTDNF